LVAPVEIPVHLGIAVRVGEHGVAGIRAPIEAVWLWIEAA
jgi:hypothetical protein